MPTPFAHKKLATTPDEIAPDGSEVRTLLSLGAGSMAHFTIPAGHTIRAVRHKTVDELWYVLSGSGEMWRAFGDIRDIVEIRPQVCVGIPVGTSFQVRNTGDTDICVIGQTMPPWPGNDEAVICEGPWPPTGKG